MDIFADESHHQLPLYLSPTSDPGSLGTNAFRFHWGHHNPVYVNPPWSLITRVVQKLKDEGTPALIVTPEWSRAPWYHTLRGMTSRSRLIAEPCSMKENTSLRPKPRWNTRFSVVNSPKLSPL